MTEQSPSTEERLVEAKVRAAKRAMLFETLWPRLWLPVAVCGVFVLLSAFEVWQWLPPRFHLSLLGLFGGALVLSLVPLVLWKRPTREKSLARIEQASALEHRPLTAYNDTISHEAASPETAALWQAHRDRAAQSLAKLKSGPARPRVDRYDPFALRALLVLALVAVTVWASTDLPGRVEAAFKVPEIRGAAPDFRIDAWISPPAYTRKEPFVLANASGANEAISVPQGSLLTVKINGSGAKDYKVSLNSPEHSQTLEPVAQAGDTYAEFTRTLDQSATLVIGGLLETVKSWPLTVLPDHAPTIAFAGPIEISNRAVMLFKYKVDDDYGVSSAEAHIDRIVEAPEGRASSSEPAQQIGKPPVFPLSLPRAPVRAADGKTYKDLTAHPWAGLPVVVTLSAKDEAGHTGYSAARGLILPERKFTKPLAKAVIGQRRSLVENPSDTAPVASNLNALGITAEDEGTASTIYLGLRSAYWRLRHSPTMDEVESVVDQLWDVAVRIEDGNLSSAERDLRASQERLKDAIERGASQEEIQKLMSELRQALNTYMQALRQQQGKNDKAARSPNSQTISPQDLQQLLDKIERLAKSGSADAAAQMLNELRDILESIQTAKGGSEEEDKESMQRLDRMTDILRQQQQLLDDTFRAQQGNEGDQSDREQQAQRGQRGQGQRQQGERGQQGQGKSSSDLRKRQDDLQRQLQELLGDMGANEKDPTMKKLQEAEGAMGDAGQALQQNDLSDAGDQEGRAVENLRQGARSMAQQMMRSGGQRGGSQANRDPLGRKQGDRLDDGESVKVPDEITVQRARTILEELRKRLGQPSRPPIELDYLERLVKPY
ncbi:MAG TPA: TIGR02302 family protein [Geobacterales bacterium]|nr:TIGR02302 family protein [Geobacterales bacterium]